MVGNGRKAVVATTTAFVATSPVFTASHRRLGAVALKRLQSRGTSTNHLAPPMQIPVSLAHRVLLLRGRHVDESQHSPPEHCAALASMQLLKSQQPLVSSHSSPAWTTPSPHTARPTQTPSKHAPRPPSLTLQGAPSARAMGGS